MSALSVRINSKNQITIPKNIREKLGIKMGDQLLIEVQGNVMILLTERAIDTTNLRGLHSEIWKDIDTDIYLRDERTSW